MHAPIIPSWRFVLSAGLAGTGAHRISLPFEVGPVVCRDSVVEIPMTGTVAPS